MTTVNEQLLTLDHEIRQTELHLAIAKRRRKWSNLSLIFGPVLGVLLYAMLWVPRINKSIILAVYIPTVPIAIAFCVASFALKRYPGGPASQGYRGRMSEGELELQLARQRDTRRDMVVNADVPAKVRRVAYKEDAYTDIDQLRNESNRYRRVNNILQGIIIIGSIAATGSSAIATELANIRWATVGITFLVGIASGFMGYFKYKERSFYLQQTADAIENEWEAVEIGVGRYKPIADENEALAAFVEEVHRLKSEQKKRQQNLEQPAESRNPND
jgi:hypothetical protein